MVLCILPVVIFSFSELIAAIRKEYANPGIMQGVYERVDEGAGS